MKRFGAATPDRIVNQPVIWPSLQFVLDAFYDLDTERNLSELHPIAWSSIVGYGSFWDLARADLEDLLYLIREADNAFLKELSDQRKSK